MHGQNEKFKYYNVWNTFYGVVKRLYGLSSIQKWTWQKIHKSFVFLQLDFKSLHYLADISEGLQTVLYYKAKMRLQIQILVNRGKQASTLFLM